MGQAKRRGSFEERKKQAIEAGRIKKSYKGSHVLALNRKDHLVLDLYIGNYIYRRRAWTQKK